MESSLSLRLLHQNLLLLYHYFNRLHLRLSPPVASMFLLKSLPESPLLFSIFLLFCLFLHFLFDAEGLRVFQFLDLFHQWIFPFVVISWQFISSL